MENLTSNIGNQPSHLRSGDLAPNPSKSQKQSQSQAAEKADDNMPAPTIASVAADAKLEKVQSLRNLETVAESINEAIEVLNETLSRRNTNAVIRRDEELNRYLVTIKDEQSGDVVREIPDEALLKFARNLETLKGILFDETT